MNLEESKHDIKKVYKFDEKIGKGSFGTVLRAVERETGQEVAIKCIKK
jgi:calcium/calmodulin-dependent protein kinase I